MASFLDGIMNYLRAGSNAPSKKVSPFKEQGSSGTAVWGGYIENKEKNPLLGIDRRYETAADILANISIVAASIRYFLNLVAKPSWHVESVDDTPEAKRYAEIMEEILYSTEDSWSRIVRRSGMYKFHGFGINEWTAKKRPEDGLIVFANIESRPQHTIERWEISEQGTVLGIWQRSPQTGQELWIPRNKFIYMIDDMITDSPEGMGWFRHLAEPCERLKEYLQLEKIGYDRDLAGVPVGRAPISAINQAVRNGQISQQDANTMIDGLKKFIQLEIKKKNTGLVLDSQPFESQNQDGPQISSQRKWDIELLKSQASSIDKLGAAIDRISMEIAQIIGTENIMTGAKGKGSMALSKDKSNNLYLHVNSTLVEMSGFMDKDMVSNTWRMNGFPEEYKPFLKTEDVSFKDIEQITSALRDMASAGAVLAPDDPAIDDVRDLMGISRQENPALEF